jgi:hypothetical protein
MAKLQKVCQLARLTAGAGLRGLALRLHWLAGVVG